MPSSSWGRLLVDVWGVRVGTLVRIEQRIDRSGPTPASLMVRQWEHELFPGGCLVRVWASDVALESSVCEGRVGEAYWGLEGAFTLRVGQLVTILDMTDTEATILLSSDRVVRVPTNVVVVGDSVVELDVHRQPSYQPLMVLGADEPIRSRAADRVRPELMPPSSWERLLVDSLASRSLVEGRSSEGSLLVVPVDGDEWFEMAEDYSRGTRESLLAGRVRLLAYLGGTYLIEDVRGRRGWVPSESLSDVLGDAGEEEQGVSAFSRLSEDVLEDFDNPEPL